MWPFKNVYDGELVTLDDVGGTLQKYSDDDFAVATKSGAYLPRLQLMTSNSDPCKSGDFPINHYALVTGKEFRDLDKEVDVLCIAWRPKALDIGDNIISVFDPNDPEFARIQEKSGEKDSGCMFGAEFLVYIPSIQEWANFFMGTKSSRREAPAMKTRLQKAATLKSQELSNKKYTWYSPLVVPCSTPLDLPDINEIKEQVEKFNNPPKSVIETVEDDAKEQRDR